MNLAETSVVKSRPSVTHGANLSCLFWVVCYIRPVCQVAVPGMKYAISDWA